ncbi:MAG: alcohol dehydrogenase [Mycobacterium sp.]|nr:alcohol dehydrogenase [Mycobacterium sp.]
MVAVLGPGIRGLCAAAAAKQAGAGFAMVTGLGPRDADRLALAAKFGAGLAVDVAVEDPAPPPLARRSGGLADVVVDVTVKAPTAFTQATALGRVATGSKTCRGAACASKRSRNCWLPWPENATVSRQYTEC